jgi:HEAT repeat protein
MGPGRLEVAIILAALALAMPGCAASQDKGGPDMETLKAQVLEKNPEAALRARQLGRKAAPLLEELSKNQDEGVRRVALNCFREVGGPEAVKAFLRGLSDEDPQVAGSAANGFNRHFEPTHAAELLAAYDKAPDPLARSEIALFLGRSNGVDLKEFRKRLEAEKDPEAAEGCVVGLAKLGDKAAQEEYVRRLHASKERERLRFIEHGSYIGAPWIQKPMLPLLDDKNVLVTQGVDARPKDTLLLRSCDLVVNLVAAVSGRKFSFKIDPFKNYNDAEIEEVRRYLKGLP